MIQGFESPQDSYCDDKTSSSKPENFFINQLTMSCLWCDIRVYRRIIKHNILVGKPEGKESLARPRRRWEDNTRMDLREVRWEVVDWIHLSQDRY
jgi:hypothetical protein